MPRFTLFPLAAALLAFVPVSAPAAEPSAPAILPAVSKLLKAPSAGTSCVAVGGYRAPMSGFLSARLRGGGDWDFVLRDRGGAQLASSSGFGGSELAQTWVQSGQRIVAEGCRGRGASRDARVTFRLVDAKPPALALVAPQLVRVRGTQEQIHALEAAGLDVTHSQGRDWADVIVAGADQLARLKHSGLPYTTRIADLTRSYAQSRAADRRYAARVGAAGSPLPTGRTSYRTYDDYQTELKQLVEQNAGVVRKVVFGKSFQGREISGVEIAKNVDASDGRPVYFVMALHHAREWPSGEAAMEYAHMLVSHQSDPRIAQLLGNERTVILPIVNPDGFVSSRGAFDPGDTLAGQDPNVTLVEAIGPPGGLFAYRRKNCDGEIFGPELPCELAWGVDNNRNYGNLWGGPGSSSDVTSQSYHGPGPRSEPETQAVWNYTRTHHVTTLMTLHNVAALVLRPPGLKESGKAPDEARMKELGDAMGKATGYTSQYGFQLYDTAGTTEDDTYAATGGYGYTIEIGPKDGNFHMPYETGVIKEWTGDNPAAAGNGGLREALLLAGESAANKPDHAILQGSAPAGKVLRLAKKFKTLTSAYCEKGIEPVVNVGLSLCLTGPKPPKTLDDEQNTTTTIPGGGAFEWHIGQSTRPFVGGGSVKETLTEVQPPLATIKGAPGAPTGNVDHEFTLPAGQQADKLKVTLVATLPEDYDIEVFYKQGDGTLKSVGASGNTPGSPEEVLIDAPAPGTYVVRVNYYAAVTGSYEVKAIRVNAVKETTTGTKEAYTLTCEQPDGTVLERHSLVIDRGQSVGVTLGCGTGPSTFADGTPFGTDPNAAPPAATPSVDGKQAPAAALAVKPAGAKSKTKAKTQTARARKLAACNKKAKRIKRAAKRRAALRSCARRYGKKSSAKTRRKHFG